MEGTKVGSIFVHSLKTTSRYCSNFIVECYSDSGLTTRVGVATSAVVWDGTYWQQKSLISFGGLVKGSTYYLRAGVVSPASGLITWGSSYSIAATNGTAPTTTYAAVYDVISTGVSYTVTPTGVPSDINHFEVYYNFTGTAPASTTIPQFRIPFTYSIDTTFHFFVSCKAGTSVSVWVRAYNTSGQTQSWTALTTKTAIAFSGTLDDVTDGSTYAKVKASALSSGQIASIQGQPVDTTAPSTNQALVWNGSKYAPTTIVSGSGGTSSGPLTGDVIKSDGSTACIVGAIYGNPVKNTGALGSADNGKVLTWVNAANQWQPVTPSGGGGTQVGPRPGFGSWSYTRVCPNINPTTLNGFDSVAQVLTNNLGGFSNWNSPSATESASVQVNTSGTANSVAWVKNDISNGSGTNCGTFGLYQCFQTRVKVDQSTLVRYWIGYTSVATPGTTFDSDTPNTNYAAFRFSTPASDAHWQAAVGTSSVNKTVVDTGVAIDTTTSHVFMILQSSGTYTFYIDGTLVATISTTTPSTSTGCDLFISIDNAAAANVRGLSMQWCYTEFNR
jgi:hypothetical protein